MSSDDPTDDELEREAARDVPLPLGGSARHAPRLETKSRAINPRALLEAERAAQSDDRVTIRRDELPDLDAILEQLEARRRPMQASSEAFASGRRTGDRPVGLGLIRPPRRAAEAHAEPAPVANAENARAWDRYVAAALGVCAMFGLQDPELTATAVAVADQLLEERRKRFG